MRPLIKQILILLCISIISPSSFADPWFTGPLLAPAGHTVPRGHTNFEMYGVDIFTDGHFDQFSNLIRSPLYRSFVANPILTHGFTDWLDVQVTVPYLFNSTRGKRYNRLADFSSALGFQLVEQNKSPTRADVRIIVQEVFPTGRYDHLNPTLAGTDSTGLGSYQTLVGLDLQYLREVFTSHYLRTRLFLSYLYTAPVKVNGLNSYGGTVDTHGRIEGGSEKVLDLAFEYTLTQHWVAVMEGTITKGEATKFNGILSIGNLGGPPAVIGSGDYWENALAPALEYNFNGNIGLIGGVWFPLSGKNTSHYTTYVLALNAYW